MFADAISVGNERAARPTGTSAFELAIRDAELPLLAGSDHSAYSWFAGSHRVSRAGRAQLIQVVGPCLHHDAALRKVLCVVVVSTDVVCRAVCHLPLDRLGRLEPRR